MPLEIGTLPVYLGSSRDSRKTLLTFYFTYEKLFLAFLINRCTKGAVKSVFDRLERTLGTYDFCRIFEYVLTDRGSEFGDPASLETGICGIARTSIYYCDPMRKWDVRTIMSHINSTPRHSLGGKTPYDVAVQTLGIDILNAFQLRRIDPDKVMLTPELIRCNH